MAELPNPPNPPEIRPGFAFHYETDDHLFFVASDIAEPQVLILNFTSRKAFSDASCVVQPGEHPFVTVRTCVAYGFAEIAERAAITMGVQRGLMVPHAPLSPDLVMRVWDGAAITRHLPLKCRDLLKRQGLI